MPAPPITELSQREADFVLFLAGYGMKPCAAAVKAGYSHPMARHLLKRPMVNAAIRALHIHVGQIVAKLDKAAGY